MLLYIQILRFFAAIAVVAFHAWGVAPNYVAVPDGTASFGLWDGGHGVDLFFVISGFIIFYATQNSDLTPGAFLRRRVERIVPLYAVVIVAVTVLALLWPAVFGTAGWYTPRHILKSLAFVSFTDGEMPVVYVGWSLEYEMYFYLVVGLLMALVTRVWRTVVLLFSLVVITGQFAGVATALGNYAFFINPLLLEFVAGVVVGHIFVKGRPDWLMVVAVACASVAVLAADPSNRAVVCGIPAACLVAGGAYLSRRRVRPSWLERAMARLGDASYSIYLAQVQTVSFTCSLVASVVPAISPLLLVFAVCCVVVMLGLLMNVAIERPVLALCRRIGRPGTGGSAPAILAVTSQPTHLL
jgi:exopolysaccharide production protein ExoZ